MGIFNKGNNKGAFSGTLSCPVCKSRRNRQIGTVGPYRLRYQCKDCSLTFQYDISNRPDHPYAPFNVNKFINLVERSKRR